MKILALPLLVLATLAACGDATSNGDRTIAAESEATASPAEAAAPTGTATPSPAPSAATIPAAIRGRWGLVVADCTSTRGDAKGLLTIDGTTLRFYESVGTLAEVKEATGTRIRATFDFTGEGMTWQRDETLDVEDDGQTLIRREYGEDAAPGPFRYTRCA